MIRRLLAGASYPFRAVALFARSPQLLVFLILPILVNFIIGVALYVGLLFPGLREVQAFTQLLDQWVDGAIANLPTWLSFLDYLILGLGYFLQFLLVLVLLLLTGFLLLQFGTLLGAPWYGQLSEKLEELRLKEAKTIVEVGFIQDIWRAILFEIKKILLWLALGIPLLMVGFIPGVGTLIITLGWITLTAFIACLDFLDGPSERRRFPFRKKIKIVFLTLPASASFSLVCWFLSSIPFLNLITIPICVASGTLFWCDRVYPKLSA